MALRSFLFAPGNHARRVEKALTFPADAVILDLEDAVAVSEKPATRDMVVEAAACFRGGADAMVLWPFFGGGPMGKAPLELSGGDGIICNQVACHPKEELVAGGLVRKGQLVKVLGNGDLEGVKVDVTANAFSGSAVEKINAAGGSTTKL